MPTLGMVGLVNAEARKTSSTAAWWALLIPAVLLCLLVTAISESSAAVAVSKALVFVAPFAAVFGVVCAAAEFSHRTITTSYLTAPGRAQLVLAKVALAAGVGAGYALVCVPFGLLGIVLGGNEMGSGAFSTVLGLTLVGMVVYALWAVVGVGIGMLIGNQIAAVLTVVLYLTLVELIVELMAIWVFSLENIREFLPKGSADQTLAGFAGDVSIDRLLEAPTLDVTPWWVTLLVFSGYAAVAVLGGIAGAQHRDIT